MCLKLAIMHHLFSPASAVASVMLPPWCTVLLFFPLGVSTGGTQKDDSRDLRGVPAPTLRSVLEAVAACRLPCWGQHAIAPSFLLVHGHSPPPCLVSFSSDSSSPLLLAARTRLLLLAPPSPSFATSSLAPPVPVNTVSCVILCAGCIIQFQDWSLTFLSFLVLALHLHHRHRHLHRLACIVDFLVASCSHHHLETACIEK